MEPNFQIPLLIFVIGALLLIAIFIQTFFQKIRLAEITGFILLGWALRAADSAYSFLPPQAMNLLSFLAEMGIFTILFRIGLESHFKNLLAQLKRASVISFVEIIISGGVGFITSYYLLNIELISSLFISIALIATSVGVSVGIWKKAKMINTKEGNLLLDLATLDDILGIAAMALVFKIAMFLHQGQSNGLFSLALVHLGIYVLKLILFIVLCYLFSHFLESRIIRFVQKFETKPNPMITVICISLLIAAAAAFFGFSTVIGAFFAGLAFSRDPKAIRMEASFEPLFAFFSPFFFIGIGAHLPAYVLKLGIKIALILTAAAIIGKIIGVLIPTLSMRIRFVYSTILSLSMIPRAEVTLVIMERGLMMGDWAVSERVYSAMVLLSLLTCIITPLILKLMLDKRNILQNSKGEV